MRAASFLSQAPDLSPSLLFLSLSPQCLLGNHVVTLPDSLLLKSAVDKNSPRPVMWKRFSRHTAYILSPHPAIHPTTPHFLPLSEAPECLLLLLTCEGKWHYFSPVRTCMCVSKRRFFFLVFATSRPQYTDAALNKCAFVESHHLSPPHSERLRQFLFVSLSCTPHVI